MAEKKSKELTKELTKEQIEAKQKELVAKIRKAPISEIAHKIKNCSDDGGKRCDDARFAVFLGAGASFQAQIKTAGQMMTEFQSNILKRDCPEITDKKKQEQWLKKNILEKGDGNEYSKLFEAFERTRTGRQKYISKLIKDKIPTFGYAMLASMIARGFINTILTTNFDDLMFIACNKFTGVPSGHLRLRHNGDRDEVFLAAFKNLKNARRLFIFGIGKYRKRNESLQSRPEYEGAGCSRLKRIRINRLRLQRKRRFGNGHFRKLS